MHDLEIRGAGEVLGDSQSGEMQEVGFNLFTEMLNRAVAQLRQGKAVAAVDLMQPLGISTEINLRTPALLPDAYCPDVHERLTLYKRLANCEAADELDAMQEELIDRFGQLPLQAQSLLATPPPAAAGANRCASEAGRHRRPDHAAVRPGIFPQSAGRPGRGSSTLIQKNRSYKLAGQDKIALLRHCPALGDKVAAVKDMIHQLTT